MSNGWDTDTPGLALFSASRGGAHTALEQAGPLWTNGEHVGSCISFQLLTATQAWTRCCLVFKWRLNWILMWIVLTFAFCQIFKLYNTTNTVQATCTPHASSCVPAVSRWNTGYVHNQSHAFSYVSITWSSQYTVICNFTEAQIVSQMLHGWLLSVILLS